MYREEQEDTKTYKVVVNHEEQYSIWPSERANPLGWNDAGLQGTKVECLAYIKNVWTDMRPLSLRKKMEEDEKTRSRMSVENSSGQDDATHEANEETLVERLASGEHPVEVGLRPAKTVKVFKDCLDRNYVHIRFTDTRGGTELGFQVDRSASDLSLADFENQRGSVHLEGELTLDYVRVRCIAEIDVATLSGRGHLRVLGDARPAK